MEIILIVRFFIFPPDRKYPGLVFMTFGTFDMSKIQHFFERERRVSIARETGSTAKGTKRESFMGRACWENREASGWERSSYDVTPTFSWRYSVSPFVLDSPLLFFSFFSLSRSPSFSILFFYSRCFPVLHLIIECALSSVLSSVAIRVAICGARRCKPDAFQLRFPKTCLTSCIYIIKLSRLRLINRGQTGSFAGKQIAAWCTQRRDNYRNRLFVILPGICQKLSFKNSF